MTLGGYSGVLIGTTSVPVWSRSPMLGGLFMASAIATGTSAVSLSSMLTGRDTPEIHSALGTIGLVAGASELALLGGYVATTGTVAKPLFKGVNGILLTGAVVASVTALVAESAGSRARSRHRLLSAVAAGATLAGGAMLRWAVVRAGHTSALDRDANLDAMKPSERNPGWGRPSGDTQPE